MAKSRRRIDGGSLATESDINERFAPETAPRNAGDRTFANLDRDRVAERAYELYLARGGGDGQAMEDWLKAERELTQRTEQVGAPISES